MTRVGRGPLCPELPKSTHCAMEKHGLCDKRCYLVNGPNAPCQAEGPAYLH
jgi:hypothetical protein